tara:strand:+ start:97 stop:240 length:144 start_codon:yes stop_codon:yes gene_type:complete
VVVVEEVKVQELVQQEDQGEVVAIQVVVVEQVTLLQLVRLRVMQVLQ